MAESIKSEDEIQNLVFEERIDLRVLAHVLWKGKWALTALATAGLAIAVIVALMLPNVYRAEALLAPSNQQSASGLAAMAGQFGGLAAIPGISFSGTSTDDAALGLETLKSRKFLSDFIVRHDILVPLMAAKGWDRDTGQIIIDADLYDENSKDWVRSAKFILKWSVGIMI